MRTRLLAADGDASASTPGENLQELQQRERQELQREQAQHADVQEDADQQEQLPDWGDEPAGPVETTACFDAADADQQQAQQQEDGGEPAEPAETTAGLDAADAAADSGAGAFRREGLPCRVLVDRKQMLFYNVGGVDLQVVGGSLEYGLIFSSGRPKNSETNTESESPEPQRRPRNGSASTPVIGENL